LRRLGECLAAQTVAPARTVVVDNASDPPTAQVVHAFKTPVQYLPQSENRGCGAALRTAEEWLLASGLEGTHWWILDDDAVPPPDSLARLLEALHTTGAGMAVPLLTDERGRVWGFPEPVDRQQRRFFRQTDDYGESEAYFGPHPHAGLWATGACQLVTVKAAVDAGLHRTDFWMLGEDLDFSMRVGGGAGLVFRADVRVPHLPPTGGGPDDAQKSYAKFCALLQNLTYLAFWNRGSGHLWRYLPGNYRRFFRTTGWSPARWWDAAGCLASGLCGRPAGRGMAQRIRMRRHR
jgi:glycosyltransferase involved in cell wall biosynthesis